MPPAGERAHDDDARLPRLRRGAAAQREHLAHLARRLLGEGQVALADRQHVGDLERAGLERLDVVAEPGRADDDPGVGERGDARLRLAGADGLDDDAVEAGGVEAVDRRAGRARQPAELAAGGEGTNEGVRMGAVLAHPDPVAEDRAAADRARRVEGEHADRKAALEPGAEEGVDQRRLAAAGHAGDADDARPAGARGERGRRLDGAGQVVVEGAEQPRDRPPVTGEGGLDQVEAVTSPSPRERGEGRGEGRSRALRRTPAAGRSRGRGAAARRSPRC